MRAGALDTNQAMGKLKTPLHVDISEATIHGALKQIRRTNRSESADYVPWMRDVWIAEISPSQTKKLLEFIKSQLASVDRADFPHIKRFRKNEASLGTTLSTVLCARDDFEETTLLELLRRHFDKDFSESLLSVAKIPDEPPLLKEAALKWSVEMWPVAWKGNPNHQDLITAEFDIDEERAVIERLISANGPSTSGFRNTTIIAEKDKGGKINILHTCRDTRLQHPLQHSVMNAIAQVASSELARRQESENLEPHGYLCHQLLVYTVHEPCTMCAMALVHSRVGRLIYLRPNSFGGIELSFFVGDRRDLNWTFDIWRWIEAVDGDQEAFPDAAAP